MEKSAYGVTFGMCDFDPEGDITHVFQDILYNLYKSDLRRAAEDNMDVGASTAVKEATTPTSLSTKRSYITQRVYNSIEMAKAISRYRYKKQRKSPTTTRYVCRKIFADSRARIRGRFIANLVRSSSIQSHPETRFLRRNKMLAS